MMVTGGHGVRMQYDYTHDTPGLPGAVSAASPRWLRLTRSGDTLTGYDSADGTHWTRVGTVTLAGLPATVQAGLFVTSPAPRVQEPVRPGRARRRATLATASSTTSAWRRTAPGHGWQPASASAAARRRPGRRVPARPAARSR